MSTEEIAAQILDAYDRGTLTATPTSSLSTFGWDDAYDVAAAIHASRVSRGERPAGRKIGFTNRNIWAEYGATSPIWAHIYDSTLIRARSGCAQLSLSRSVSPRIEPEIAFELAAPIAPGLREPAVILQSIAWFAPSFEIVDCHFANWQFKAADSAADQSLHWRLVIGEPVTARGLDITELAQQLGDCEVDLSCNGKTRDRGTGSNALGHPALALAFLADVVARQPRFAPLAAGEIITTGTLTAALPVSPGETWTSTISGLPVAPLTLELIA